MIASAVTFGLRLAGATRTEMNPWPRSTTRTLLLEVANAAGLFADARFERLLGSWLFRSRLWEAVVDGDDIAFPSARDYVIGALTDRIFFQLQLPDIGADHQWALVGFHRAG